MNPMAQVTDMLVEDLDGEFVIYDQARDLAHTLNRTASIVWQTCDGTRTVSEVAAVLQSEGIAVADDDLVRLSIDHLAAAGLMDAAESRGPAEVRLLTAGATARTGRKAVPLSEGTCRVTAAPPPVTAVKRIAAVHGWSGSSSRPLQPSLSSVIGPGLAPAPGAIRASCPSFSGPAPGSDSDTVATDEAPSRVGGSDSIDGRTAGAGPGQSRPRAT